MEEVAKVIEDIHRSDSASRPSSEAKGSEVEML